jgi:hypothetical protein
MLVPETTREFVDGRCPVAVSHLTALAAGAGIAAGVARFRRSDAASTARLAGSTVAAPSAVPWFTDLLNAAYFAREPAARDVADLRLAFTIVTTSWAEHGMRRLGAREVLRFHQAFGGARLRGAGGGRWTLDRASLLDGGDRLFGSWFPAAVADPARRGWGIAFPTAAAKAAHDPEERLRRAELGPPTPPQRPDDEQVWHTFPPVEVPDAAATVTALLAVEQWPEYASELGRFTPLRRGGLAGQTFEVEVIGGPARRLPLLLRSYVTVEHLVTADEEDEDHRALWSTQVRLGFAARPEEPSPIPEDATIHLAFDLVAHEGHFMGNAKERLIVYTHLGRSFVRAASSWDPLPPHLATLYDQVGRGSQHAFWGMGRPEQSMLHQLAAAVERRASG